MSVNQLDAPPEKDLADQSRPRLSRALSLLLGLAALFIITQGIEPMRSTIVAAFLALNLIIAVQPIQRLLSRFLPRVLASMIAGLTAIAVLGTMIWAIGWALARLVRELPNYRDQFNGLIVRIVDLGEQYNLDTNAILDSALNQISSINLSTIISALGGIATGVGGAVFGFVLVIVILFFMAIDSAGFTDRLQRVGERHNPAVAWALASFAKGARKYWVVTTGLGFVIAICNTLLLTALDVPMAVTWAILGFVCNYIPAVGFFLGMIPPALMALLALPSPWTALWVIIGYIVINTIITTFIQPKVAGDAVGITPTVAILSLFVWAYILGPVGLILAIPSTLFVKKILIDIDPNARWLNAIIASNPTTSDQDPLRLADLLERAKRIRKHRRQSLKGDTNQERLVREGDDWANPSNGLVPEIIATDDAPSLEPETRDSNAATSG
ncbi:MAG: AI-2E family transporter [Propionibacteriaceae bacterium]|jgi:predicted PurR-regulated permease PerM|nr:AI-2E family transporter [Propionibacteriaceae bacterium]